ncbi:6575_t:CDS:1 [Funneliformis geosporum]|uniref:19266_t:CDS:1 n=1 Tax=Funneliformis geosporum TaxID=1117311 RepID=A0A9W4T2B3_9GLOM|nr:19266_t:CDS:1 [Funneliformis geosporum]CAI2190320.1 6575_t:CDS:1 [Funneliformis geosporum]
MTILLIIDGLQNIMKSNNDWNDKSSKFFITLTNIHDLALQSAFVILLCTAIITDSVNRVLTITHRKRVYLPIASLDPPIIIKDDIVTSIFQTDDYIIKMLVNDCGGHGRALEVLQEILKDRDIQNVNINDMINDLHVRLHDWYCEALMMSPSEARTIAQATLTRHLLKFDKHVPSTNKYSDHIVQPELIRYVHESNSSVEYFDLPYIWIWILTNSSDSKDPVIRDWLFCDYEDHRSNQNQTCLSGSHFWQHFEHFVFSFHTLKSRNLGDCELILISSIHIGARLNGDFKFKNHHLELKCAVHQEDTNSSNYGKGKKEIKCEDKIVDVCECKYCIINDASAPYGDAFLGLDVDLKSGKPNEVHQYKRWKVNSLTGQDYQDERNKSALSKDFFILFTTTNCSNFKLPKNSGIVDASNWDKYFGPYSGKTHTYANVGPLNINKASCRDLRSMYGIGETQADEIMAKREFKDIEEAKKQTGIPERVLKRFKFSD